VHIVFDSWHLRNAQIGGGIARDSAQFYEALKKIGTLTLLKFNNEQENTLESSIKVHSKKILYLMGLLGKKIDLRTPCDVFWCSQPSMIINSKAKQTFIRIHDIFPLTHPQFYNFRQKLYFRNAFRNIDKSKVVFLVNSNSTAMQLQEYLGLRDLKIHVLQCAVSIPSEMQCNKCSGCRTQTNLENFDLMVGTIEPRKNYELANLMFKKTDLNLVIVGRKGWKSRKIVRKLKNNQNITWVNDCCDGALVALYKKSNRFISTSFEEGFNIPAWEAALLGKDLILSDISVHRELHRYEILISPHLPEAWIKRLKNKNLYKPKIVTHVHQNSQEFEKIIKELINSHLAKR
jgi:glycosyltransferase involved in cell wall biosynthesis